MVVKLHLLHRSLHSLSKRSGAFLPVILKPIKRFDFAQHTKHLGTMASSAEAERLKAQAEKAEAMISCLQDQINAVRKAAVKQAGLGEEEKLKKENAKLKQEVQALTTALIIAEIKNGVRQVPLPSKTAAAAATAASVEAAAQNGGPVENGPASDSKQQKDKQKNEAAASNKKAKTEGKAKKEGDGNKAKKAAGGGGGAADVTIDVSRLDMRVGKIVAVERHPNADKLYVEQVDLGEGKIRTIVSGLVDHVPISAMKDRVAVFMCNLKPVKMRDIFSQGMIMCAGSDEKTEILVPPAEAEIGDRVIFEDYPGVPDEQMNPKKKIWETLKPDVRTDKDRVATYKGCPFTIKGKGVVVAPTLANAQIS